MRASEAQLEEAGRGVELWRNKVAELQEKEDRKLLEMETGGIGAGGASDDDDEDEFGEEKETLESAKAFLAEAERKQGQVEASLKRLESEALAAAEKEMEEGHRSVKSRRRFGEGLGFGSSEEEGAGLKELCPDRYRALLEESAEEEAVRDVHDYLALIGQEATRRAQRLALDLYRKCRSVRELRRLARTFAIAAPQLGAAAAGEGVDRPEVPTPASVPELLALEFTSATLSKPEDVLRSVKHMLAMEVAYEPRLRGLLRKAYRRGATLSTRPTVKGRTELDELHRFHGLQHLKRKPLDEMLQAGGTSTSSSSSSYASDPALFLRVLQAEKEGFLSYTLDAPGASKEDREDGYGRRGTTEWEEALAKLERFYQPPSELAAEAMVRCWGCLVVGWCFG